MRYDAFRWVCIWVRQFADSKYMTRARRVSGHLRKVIGWQFTPNSLERVDDYVRVCRPRANMQHYVDIFGNLKEIHDHEMTLAGYRNWWGKPPHNMRQEERLKDEFMDNSEALVGTVHDCPSS